jgi:hypothetical protein
VLNTKSHIDFAVKTERGNTAKTDKPKTQHFDWGKWNLRFAEWGKLGVWWWRHTCEQNTFGKVLFWLEVSQLFWICQKLVFEIRGIVLGVAIIRNDAKLAVKKQKRNDFNRLI